jgi:ribonucleotide reductase alpha subunit
MLVLNDWHADILSFIACKRDYTKINGANISVGFSDVFMKQKDEEAGEGRNIRNV